MDVQEDHGHMRRRAVAVVGAIAVPNALPVALLLVVFAFAVRYQIRLFNFGFWQDEFETMVTSKMMAAGLRLYSDIFNQHGPLIFAFGSALDATVDATIADYRLLIAVLQWLMIGALMLGSSKMPPLPRALGLAIVVVLMVTAFPSVFGQMFMYQTVGGIFTAAAISLLVLPTLHNDRNVSGARAVVGGLLLGCLPFFAFTYAVASAGLILCSLTRSTWRAMTIGVTLALILNAAFIITHSSISGFVADHLYLNVMIYPPFTDVSLASMWGTARKGAVFASAVGLALLVATAVRLITRQRAARWRVVFFVLAIASLLSRGPNFHAVPFFYAMLPLVLAATLWLPLAGAPGRFASFAIIVACIVKLSLLLPSDIRTIEAGQIPKHTAFSDLVQRFTDPSDRIIAYSFNNSEYILSHRLPASGAFFFLPQQSVYNAHPILGIVSDPCVEIRVSKPKFVMLDKWLAWGKIPWESYGTCIDEIMQDSYGHINGTQIYVRKDLWPSVEKAMHLPDRDRTAP